MTRHRQPGRPMDGHEGRPHAALMLGDRDLPPGRYGSWMALARTSVSPSSSAAEWWLSAAPGPALSTAPHKKHSREGGPVNAV